MTSVLRSFLPGSSSKRDDHDDEYSVEYSFAIEYTGPELNHHIIPRVLPIDIRHIPIASVAAKPVSSNDLSVPVIQPIVKKSDYSKKLADSSSHGSEVGEFGSCRSVRLSKSGNHLGFAGNDESCSINGGDRSSSSSGTLGFSDAREDHSNPLSQSSDVELDNDINDYDVCVSNEIVEDCEGDSAGRGNRTPVVTFRELPSNETIYSESDHEDPEIYLEKPVISDVKKGLCQRCNKKNRFADKEACIVCGAKYCISCVLKAMGSMPEGRKCISCIGYRIDESKRRSLGKCSRMLKKLLSDDVITQIMMSEKSCGANQLPPRLIVVNEKPLSINELITLQNCANPPKNLKPGNYWYDKVAGFWGKVGEKPCQIITPELPIGYQIRADASNGKTNVTINGREITKAELLMLQADGINCEGNINFWVTPDGSCKHEGMNHVIGKLWNKKRARLLCAALSLPFPSGAATTDEEEMSKAESNNIQQKMMNKLIVVGCDQSGTSTIYKQARILYNVPFSEDEKQNIKFMIQRNVYYYIAILLDARESFQEEYFAEVRRQRADEPGPSEISEEKSIYSLSKKLEAFSSWLLHIVRSGNLELVIPAATREYAPRVEELWIDETFQAVYKRCSELNLLPRVANYFLARAVEISRKDYEPCEMDILYSEGITTSNGIASMEFSFPKSSDEEYMESSDQNDEPIRYQLIRAHASSLGKNCKWLEMFEDVDLVIYCVSLTDYDEYYEDLNGMKTNKMMSAKKHFETVISNPTFSGKKFLLILNKLDLLEEKIERVPLTNCEWFHDFSPVMSIHPHNPKSNNNPSLALRAFHYIAVKFKRLFDSVTGQKLYVTKTTGLEGESVDRALRYGREILKWNDERDLFSTNELSMSTEEEPSSSV